MIRKFEIIGEAARHVPDWIRERYSDVPWGSMIGMRNRLIHAYFGIDYRLVWDTIKVEFPKVKPQLLKILEDLGE